ncbi:DUF1127 domain-containing protein [Pseudooceanicola algae]|uniref:YjiS-like domain-containing protein n=1 Tax=Pseudooceanicola algae TaxID=1537215 RepID=A0A418SFH0_9RHOB|nr:DUF1127 domain-containing protein [Pseudooceanicola algae]QPM89207.1 hypothetical protein PSAL_004220 [Pseudooceanicola algae]
MAMATGYQGQANEGQTLLVRLFAQIGERYARYAAYRKCLDELSSMNNRELSDLGLRRSLIRTVAYQQAYGQPA